MWRPNQNSSIDSCSNTNRGRPRHPSSEVGRGGAELMSARGVRSPAVVAAVGLLWSCAANTEERTESRQQAVIYQENDLEDYYELTESRPRDLVRGSTLALFYREGIDLDDPYDVKVAPETLGESANYCSETPFLGQPHAARCTATLLDDDLVVSAGHCLDSQQDCENTMFVFDYFLAEDDRLETIVSSEDVFYCDELLTKKTEVVEDTDGFITGFRDYAIVRLDRSVGSERTPVPVQLEARAATWGAPLLQVGTPLGTPIKVDDGGSVELSGEVADGYFLGSTDGFKGASGSGVYDDEGRLIGIFGGGRTDFRDDNGCLAPVTRDASGEFITSVFHAIEDYCAASPNDARLCPPCGDGLCSELESHRSCLADCAVPAGWECEAERYDSLDGCDCECGLVDPDCEVGACEANEVAGLAGAGGGSPPSGGSRGGCSVSGAPFAGRGWVVWFALLLLGRVRRGRKKSADSSSVTKPDRRKPPPSRERSGSYWRFSAIGSARTCPSRSACRR